MKLPPSSSRWKCGNCETWNSVTHATCDHCHKLQAAYACAYQYENQLSPEEITFYKLTVPELMRTVHEIRDLIVEIRDVVAAEWPRKKA